MLKKPLYAITLFCLLVGLQACAPLLVGGAFMGGTLVASDRRTVGAQTEDQGIEFKSLNALPDALNRRGNVSATSYNRQVLLTGEVSSEQEKKMVEDTVSRVDNVQKIVNELAIMPVTSIGQRSSDVLITGRVRAALVDAKDIYANAFKVVTERGTTHLMGRVSQREADRATDIARTTSGVQKVVRIFEIISEEDLKGLLPQPAKPSSSPAVAPNPG